MSTEYALWFLHPTYGYPLALVETYDSLDYVKNTNAVGAFDVNLPATFDISLVQEDTRFVVMRKSDGVRSIDFAGFVRYIERAVRNDSEVWHLAGNDLNELLNARIVAYSAGSSQAEKTDQADDMMKAIVRENLGASAIAARNLSAYGFTVQADAGLGTSLTKGFSWRNVLLALREIADASHSTEATSVYFGVVPLNIGFDCEFRTNVLKWGNDHRLQVGTQGAVIFSLELGNVIDAMRSFDYRDEINYAYAGGQGEGAARLIQEASDSARIGVSPFNRREIFVDARNLSDSNSVLAEANTAVRNGRPHDLFQANLSNIGQYIYGRDFGHGDYVTAIFLKEQIDCRLETVRVQVSGGNENVTLFLRRQN